MHSTQAKYFLLLLLFLSQFSHSQECHGDSLFSLFKKDIQIELARYKMVNWDDETRKSYYTLMINCPVETLTRYVDDSIPAIRCLVFVGLVNKNADKNLLTEIVNRHKGDTAIYLDSPTDVVNTWIVNEYMQTTLSWKAADKIPGPNYEPRLAAIGNNFHYIVPGLYHGTVPKDSLLKMDSLACSRKGYRVVSFRLNNGTETIPAGNIFTPQIKELIRNTKPGEVLSFEAIIIEDPDGSRQKYVSLSMEIK